MRAACGVLGCASAISRHSTRCRTPSSNARAPPRAFAAVARRAAARATGVGGRDSAVSRREKVGTPKGTYRDDGEARVRDARRGGGRAELRAGEGPGEGKPRHVEKTRHSSSGVLRTRVRAQVPRQTSACDARRARRGFSSLLLSTPSVGVRKILVYWEIKPSIEDSFSCRKSWFGTITAARALRSGVGNSETPNAVDRSAKSCFGDVFAQTAAERCGLDASRPPAQRAAPERRGVVETATACEARTSGERGRGRSSSAREHARGPVGRASVLIASERGPNGHARSREARAMGGGSGGGRGVQMAPPPFKANPSHIKYRAYTEGDGPNADVRVRPSPAFLSSSALSVSARIRRSTVGLGRV